MRTYRVQVFNKTTGEPFEDYGFSFLFVVARNKKEAALAAHKEADRKGWFDRYSIRSYDTVRVCSGCKEDWLPVRDHGICY